MICASIKAESIDEAINEIKMVKDVDLIEMRADYLKSFDEIGKLSTYRDKLIVAIRRRGDMGEFNGDEEKRLELFKKFLDLRPLYVDVEMDSEIASDVVKLARARGVKVIVSYHNFAETPSLKKLRRIREEAAEMGADVTKIVTYARKTEDNLTVLKLVSEANSPIIAFCMGELGKISRVLSPLFGSAFTYASARRGRETAPGQVTAQELKSIWGLIR